MDEVRVIELKKSIFESNDREADLLRSELKSKGVFLLNLMSAPGSGKTTTLIQTINRLKDKLRIAVMEADIDSDVDAKSIAKNTGVHSIQLHTGGMCHLDAFMTKTGLDAVDSGKFDVVFLENVGNLVCPAEFDTGASLDVVILSVSEGDDKPLKYPLIFEKCDLVIISKIDAKKFFTFDFDKCVENIRMRNKNATIVPISNRTGEGIDALTTYFLTMINKWKEN